MAIIFLISLLSALSDNRQIDDINVKIGWFGDYDFLNVVLEEHALLTPSQLEILLRGTIRCEPPPSQYEELAKKIFSENNCPILSSVRVRTDSFRYGLLGYAWLIETPAGVRKYFFENDVPVSCSISKEKYNGLWAELEKLGIWEVRTDAAISYDAPFNFVSAMIGKRSNQAVVVGFFSRRRAGESAEEKSLVDVGHISALVTRFPCDESPTNPGKKEIAPKQK